MNCIECQTLKWLSMCQREMEALTFINDKEWDKQSEKCHHLLAKLVFNDHPLPIEEKGSKLLRTLISRFESITMVPQSSNVPFESVIESVKTELSGRKSQGNNNWVLPTAAVELQGIKKLQGVRWQQKTMQDCRLCMWKKRAFCK